ncbi:RNA-binding S4 domain-containing protein [Naumannella halotolerans]|uniref:Ribosome-associated heat shock protein Hsp15 n=1 Tax=Naumannella halotolerans TaxID=993414 RepID=A0A4R7JAM9_9ACTN|nr:RNA-binding S4 domain-containing protein [Naumannella halotolerans]TDT33976.1 ribosome-associated heat shock protein Hsp15 [Naumannella halotolerans]
MAEKVRVDSWLWAVRLLKSRSLATNACKGGHVRVGGERVKASQQLHIGDEVRLRMHGVEKVVVVQQLLSKRVSAPLAQAAYLDNSPPPPPKQVQAWVPRRDPGAGRPTKRDRRAIDRLRGRDSHL